MMPAMDPSRVWLPELVERIAVAMPLNYAACTLRLVNKATAAQFRGRPEFSTVRLSQPVPPHAFALQWTMPGATRRLTLQQRHRLLCLTAASGSILNMEVALASVGFILNGIHTNSVLMAAAAAGKSEMCAWLLERRLGSPEAALRLAAQKGQRDVCELLLPRVDKPSASYARWAALGGHLSLLDWLLQQPSAQQLVTPAVSPAMPPSPSGLQCLRLDDRRHLLAAAAAGCDLPTLQSLHQRCYEAQPAPGQEPMRPLSSFAIASLLDAAAGGSNPDWRAKVEWLESLLPEGELQEQRQREYTAAAAAGASDGLTRLTWLRQRGYNLRGAAAAAAEQGAVAVLEYLVAEAGGLGWGNPCAAARNGQLGALKYLLAQGQHMHPAELIRAAVAVGGNLPVLSWVEEAFGVVTVEPETVCCAAATGDVEVLAWLHERGVPLGAGTFMAAAKSGCEEALEWLAERGCPLGSYSDAYEWPARQGDLSTLRCLQRLGCPWGPAGQVFTTCVQWGCLLPVLRWLAEAGCPVDWEAAVQADVSRCGRLRVEATQSVNYVWLEEQRRMRLETDSPAV